MNDRRFVGQMLSCHRTILSAGMMVYSVTQAMVISIQDLALYRFKIVLLQEMLVFFFPYRVILRSNGWITRTKVSCMPECPRIYGNLKITLLCSHEIDRLLCRVIKKQIILFFRFGGGYGSIVKYFFQAEIIGRFFCWYFSFLLFFSVGLFVGFFCWT